MAESCRTPRQRFLCVEADDETPRCDRQCAECAEIESREREEAPEDDGEDTNVEDSYAR
jgi:hypothetical protein